MSRTFMNLGKIKILPSDIKLNQRNDSEQQKTQHHQRGICMFDEELYKDSSVIKTAEF